MSVLLPKIGTFREYKTNNMGINFVKVTFTDNMAFYYFKKEVCALHLGSRLLIGRGIPWSVRRNIINDSKVGITNVVTTYSPLDEAVSKFIKETKEREEDEEMPLEEDEEMPLEEDEEMPF